jgi:hypothetical protein
MKTCRVGATEEDATCDVLSVEIEAGDAVRAAQKFQAMGYDVWEDDDGRQTAWVDDGGPGGPVCVDLDEGEVIKDGEGDA